MAAVPFRQLRSTLSRWAVGLALLAVLAQALVAQASAGHMAGMLSARWLTGQICTGAGMLTSAPDFGDPGPSDESRQLLAQCQLCAVAVLPLLVPRPAPEALPVPVAQHRRPALLAGTPLRPAPQHLLPPAQGPPARA